MLTLMHISDLHFGRFHLPAVAEAVLRSAAVLEPDVIVASGDFTQRARPHEFEAARAFLDRLPPVPRVVCPGNHDGKDTLFQLFTAVERSFKGVPEVEVRVHPGRFASFRVGTTLHVLDHGYGIPEAFGWRGKAQAEVVARSLPGFEGAETILTYMGHLHNRTVSSSGDHHTLIRLEALTEPDDYAIDLRHRHRPAARLFRLDEKGRIVIEHVLYAETLCG